MNAIEIPTQNNTTPLEHFCAPILHLITGKSITNYNKLGKYPETIESWTKSVGKEWGNLEQVYLKTGTKGTISLFVLYHKEIKRTPADHTVTYTNIVVDCHPKKADPNRFRITAYGNLINYPG